VPDAGWSFSAWTDDLDYETSAATDIVMDDD
jgi:hypothetical protein